MRHELPKIWYEAPESRIQVLEGLVRETQARNEAEVTLFAIEMEALEALNERYSSYLTRVVTDEVELESYISKPIGYYITIAMCPLIQRTLVYPYQSDTEN